jgi:putative transposase
MKAAVEHVQAKYAFTERRACRLLLVPVSSYRYKPRHRDEELRERLVVLAREKPRYGYRRLHVLLGREGGHVNHKRVHRIYRDAGLALRRKKRKHCVRVSAPLGSTQLPTRSGLSTSCMMWWHRAARSACST